MLLPARPVDLLNSRVVQLALLVACLVAAAIALHVTEYGPALIATYNQFSKERSSTATVLSHPIDWLIHKSKIDFDVLVKRRTTSVAEGAKIYEKRRGRRPPPGFDAWYAYAQEKNAVIVEEFFDQIYHDLGPFWAVPPRDIREQANGYEHRISIRAGEVSFRTDNIDERPWMNLWSDMVRSIATHLPDLDMAINHMDESRIVVPWEEVASLMRQERMDRQVTPSYRVKQTFGTNLTTLDENPPPAFDPEFATTGSYWDMAVLGCPPGSPSYGVTSESDFRGPPPVSDQIPVRSFEGYVSNWTFAKSPCDDPAIRTMHGTFIEPLSMSNSRKLFPLFGGSKLPMNNEILLPPAMYWTNDSLYSGGEDHGREWATKKSRMIWRGDASGGRNRAETWTRYQRHRFVSMVNATTVLHALDNPQEPPPNFVLPATGTEHSFQLVTRGPEHTNRDFADWIASWSDAKFTHLLCFPDEGSPNCSYTNPYFSTEGRIPMREQYNYKYLPDIDGNSFSGRYRGFLLSTSVPIKATIYQEWHDSRLVPWRHFVPMHNSFIDFYGIMEYFLGAEKMGLDGHDHAAEIIAMEGQRWAQTVLRKEDMSVYVFRLLLEYARVCDDDRDILGWVGPYPG